MYHNSTRSETKTSPPNPHIHSESLLSPSTLRTQIRTLNPLKNKKPHRPFRCSNSKKPPHYTCDQLQDALNRCTARRFIPDRVRTLTSSVAPLAAFPRVRYHTRTHTHTTYMPYYSIPFHLDSSPRLYKHLYKHPRDATRFLATMARWMCRSGLTDGRGGEREKTRRLRGATRGM
jgi:hypothetical protein